MGIELNRDRYDFYGGDADAALSPDVSPFAQPGRLTTGDYSKPTETPAALPAVDLVGDKTTPAVKPANDATGRWPDSGKFDVTDQGQVYRTVSADGGKVREFAYENPANPDEITRIRIDGNREYIKNSEDPGAFDYYVDGQYVGQWKGTVSMTRDGVYTYNGEREGTHVFGSGKDELSEADLVRAAERSARPAPLPAAESVLPSSVDSLRPPSSVAPVAPSAIRPVDYRTTTMPELTPLPQLSPMPELPRWQSPEPKPEVPAPKPPVAEVQKPAEKAVVKPAEKRPNLKERYETEETELAMRKAAELGLPVFLRIGSKTCGPCLSMEGVDFRGNPTKDGGVWPKLEKEFAGQGVFVHVDGDLAEKPGADRIAQQIRGMDAVEGYPTIMVLRPRIGPNNQLTIDPVLGEDGAPMVHGGKMTIEETMNFLELKRR